MKATVHITLKSGVLDPQGQAVGKTLSKLGFAGVGQVRIGKFVEIELAEQSYEQAHVAVTRMCEELIANTVIEDYRVEIEAGETL